MEVWLVWDGLHEDRDVHSVHATQAVALEQAAKLIGQHEVSRARDAVAYPDRGMYRQPVQHHTSTDCDSWSTAVWEVSVERRDVA